MGDCIEFAGYRDRDGYGIKSHRGKNRRAHRLAWEAANGPILADLQVLHHCDNPPCVNVEHLFLGTPADNSRDKVAKGRNRCRPLRGTEHPRAKLTPEQVREIRDRVTAGELHREVAALYGVTKGLISQISRRVIWVEV